MSSSRPDMSAAAQLDEKSKAEIAQWADAEIGKAKVRSAIHGFTDLCFKKCVDNAGTGMLSTGESSCVKNCVDRFLDTNTKIVELIAGQAQ